MSPIALNRRSWLGSGARAALMHSAPSVWPCATNGTPTATVTLIDSTGHEITDAATGDGPIDAMFAVIQRITHISGQLLTTDTGRRPRRRKRVRALNSHAFA